MKKKRNNQEPQHPALRVGDVIGSALSPSDFRIGNYLTSKQWGGIFQIEGIEVFENHFEIKSKGYVHKFEKDKYFDLAPITLTEEILEKMGFLLLEGGFWSKGIIELGYITTDEYFEFEFRFPFTHWHRNALKYVHELQNLYYTLSGEELVLS
jgi:hypothetical protein